MKLKISIEIDEAELVVDPAPHLRDEEEILTRVQITESEESDNCPNQSPVSTYNLRSFPPRDPGIRHINRPASSQNLSSRPRRTPRSSDVELQLPVALPVTNEAHLFTGEELIIDGTIVRGSNERKCIDLRNYVTYFIASIFVSAIISLLVKGVTSKKNGMHETENVVPSPWGPTEASLSPAPTSFLSGALKDIFVSVSGINPLDDPLSIQYYVWQKLALDFPLHVSDRPLDLVDDRHIIIQRYTIMVVGLTSMLEFFKAFQNEDRVERQIAYDCEDFNCNENGEISIYVLENRWSTNRAGGLLAREIGHLKSISHLILTRGKYKGTIPTEIGLLQNLRVLDLSGNFYSGTIPSEIGLLNNLEWLVLKENSLTGAIPSTLQNMKNLIFADFTGNSISGSIPSQLKKLQHLKGLSLSKNKITGSAEMLCDLNFSNDFFSETEDIGKARGIDRFYTYEGNFSLTMDCSSPCSCCVCH